jgi:NAD(P)-dependent dehydrogenase (short-subunit alcohol dehydrogenase family)
MDRLKDRVTLVTGAGQGIGRGIARRFAREGARVVVAEIDEETGNRTAKELCALGAEALFVRTDIGDKADVDAMVDATVGQFGRIDVLVNNAWSGGGVSRVEWYDRPPSSAPGVSASSRASARWCAACPT